MAKISVKDLATELNIDVNIIKSHLNEKGHDIKTSSKQIDDETANMVRQELGNGTKKSTDESVIEKKDKIENKPEEKATSETKEPTKVNKVPVGPNGKVAPSGMKVPIGPDGRPIRPQGQRIPVGPDGKPIRPQGQRIPVGPDGKPIRPQGQRIPVGPDGKPIRPQGQRIPVGPDGKPIRPDGQRIPLGPDGKPIRMPNQKPQLGPDGKPIRNKKPVDEMARQIRKEQARALREGNKGKLNIDLSAFRKQEPNKEPKAVDAVIDEDLNVNKSITENTNQNETTRDTDINTNQAAAKVIEPKEETAVISVVETKENVEIKTSEEKTNDLPLSEIENKKQNIVVEEKKEVQADTFKSRDNQRPANRDGQRSGGFNGNRDGQRTGGYQGNRDGQRNGSFAGTRDGQRSGGFNGNRDGQRSGGFNGNRDGQRSGGFTGNRDGQRSGNFQGKPDGNRFGGQRPNGGKPGFGSKDAGFDKDKDSNYNQRSFGDRRNNRDNKGDKIIKNDLANEITKEQRAVAFSNKDRDKNKSRDKRRDFDSDMSSIKSKKDPNRKGAFIMPKPVQVVEEDPDEIRTILIPEVITLKELASKINKPVATLIKKMLIDKKKVTTINSEFSFEEAEELALEYNCIAEKEVPVNIVEELLKEDEEDESLMVKRPPVVCVMGHVDHGKTSLLDAIRETNVTAKEAGGITQHIGAYVVEAHGEKITFLDTPGHEAFTSMRMRGAKSTDIAILVVAADDGVMPQTVEAINHAKAAGVSIIVAVNKIDKPGANIDKVKQELTEHSLVAEDWGGDTIFVPVSAKTKEGIDQLLDMILLTAEIGELKANPNRLARGIVIEAELDKGRGPVATILVQKGTLHVGDNITIGSTHGKVRAMLNDRGVQVKTALPSMPVEILGLNGVPGAGEIVMSVKDEKEARTIAQAFIAQSKEKLLADTKAKLSLDGLFNQIQAGNIKELNLIIKADVQGSVEAVKQSLVKLSNEEVVVRIIHGGVGAINESDVNLASASNAIIIGFNVKPDNTAKDIAEREKVEVKLYKVIYQAIQDVENAMKGMLAPIYEEKVIGHAEIRQIFKASGLGTIAGSYVLDGKIVRGSLIRITREGEKIYEGSLASLKRFKDDVKEVATSYECGLVFEKFNDCQELDIVEAYIMEEVPR